MTEPASPRLVILGAGPPARPGRPAALVSAPGAGRIIDWQLQSLAAVGELDITFVAGYGADEIARRCPDLDLRVNPSWRTTGAAGSLAVARIEPGRPLWIVYADVVFRPETVLALEALETDIAIAIDTCWLQRYEARRPTEREGAEKVRLAGSGPARVPVRVASELTSAEADAEFAGLVRLSGRAAAALATLLADSGLDREGLPAVLTRLLDDDSLTRAARDLAGDWAELNAPQDLAKFVLRTKAESLERLKPLVKRSVVADLVRFDFDRWSSESEAVLGEIRGAFAAARVIVRSSAIGEDRWDASGAGAFESVLDVDPADDASLRGAIERVFASYGAAGARDQVLVQPMLREVVSSGVLMTRSPGGAAPYYVLNDDSSGRTDTVTGGLGRSRTIWLHRRDAPAVASAELRPVLEMAREVEDLVGHDSLDLEFARTADGVCHLLQVRPIAATPGGVTDEAVAAALDHMVEELRGRRAATPFVLGESVALNVMTDWNPAEIIGVKPRRLAFSLYRRLVTDDNWARWRAEEGYRDVRPCELLLDLGGHPYVDVAADFTSFIPAALPDELAGRLVAAALERLAAHPEHYDKVEFEVVPTALSFDLEDWIEQRWPGRFAASEVASLVDALRDITLRAVARTPGDLAAAAPIERRLERILAAEPAPLERALLLLAEAAGPPTAAFAHLARAAFMATEMLRSLVRIGVLTESEVEALRRGIDTPLRRLSRDAARVRSGERSFAWLVETYGHLRPGTYDLTSPTWGSDPETFLRSLVEPAQAAAPDDLEPKPEGLSAEARGRVAEALTRRGLELSAEQFCEFVRGAIGGRETAKFVFTRHLSAALEALAEFGASCGVDREALSLVSIDDLAALRAAPAERRAELLRRRIEEGEAARALTLALNLPRIINTESDLRGFEKPRVRASFVTRGSVRAPVAVIEAGGASGLDPAGCIAVIPNADPGFDWLFGRGILGLITMFGGANSHMAVRAAELDLPAAIGVDERLFERLVEAELVELDGAAETIRILR